MIRSSDGLLRRFAPRNDSVFLPMSSRMIFGRMIFSRMIFSTMILEPGTMDNSVIPSKAKESHDSSVR